MSINPKSFDKNYYYNVCLGSEEFKSNKGLTIHPKLKRLIDSINLNKNMDVLDIGCGRGDITLYIASKVNTVIGIDYSPEAIKIAKKIRKGYRKKIKSKSKFYVMKATNLKFSDKKFDLVIMIDTLDHLNKKEQIKTINEINRVLKTDGQLFIKTCTNKILISKTYPLYIFPLNKSLTWIDKKIKKSYYESLPKDPRTTEQKKQHINESDYFSVNKLIKQQGFKGKIITEVGFVKDGSGLRTKLYNFLITLYPFSKFYPLCIFFGSSFIYTMKKNSK